MVVFLLLRFQEPLHNSCWEHKPFLCSTEVYRYILVINATEIPEYIFESLARSLLPVIQKYYESESGKKAFAEWKAKKEISDSAST
jgi:hypothetical protein